MPPCGADQPLRVLVVDDQAGLRAAVAELFEVTCQAEVQQAGSGPAALELVGGYVPDVVVTDLRMPGMDGLALLRELRGRLPLARLVLFSASAGPELARAARLAGADQVIAKGDPPGLLVNAVRGQGW